MKAYRAFTADPQDYKLREMMERLGMRHGDEAIVSINSLNIRPAPGSFDEEGEIFFCDIEEIKVHKILKFGDNKDLPHVVEFPTLVIPDWGITNMGYALIGSNGRIYVRRIEETKIKVI